MVNVNALRVLAAETIENAQSGHPGMPLGMADIATVLFLSFLKHHPLEPRWQNRDRFVLSNGHGSMLQYAILHLTGYDLSLEDLKQFRKLDSKTPGHPEYPEVPGVETSTGPLGQGLANAVGIALAQKHMASRFNRPEFAIIDHFTYVFAGDGCLMEGVTHEASALAGQWSLGHLIVAWDDNGISIDGNTQEWFSEDVCQRYRSYDWHVIEQVDGHDFAAIEKAFSQAKANTQQPTLIQFKTKIGFGAPNVEGTASVHGKPLGESELQQLKDTLNWSHEPFEIPSSVYEAWDARESGAQSVQQWMGLWHLYQEKHPDLSQQLQQIWQGELPKSYYQVVDQHTQKWLKQSKPLATRKASQQFIETVSDHIPQLMGGSADLTESNLTKANQQIPFSQNSFHGTYLYYGVREFAMFAIANGLAVSNIIPYVGTFLVFMDYGRNALRMAAMMRLRVVFIFTHDSIGLGEDGPTHQPVEHLGIARITPNLDVWRPADLAETAMAWHQSIQRTDGPSAIMLSRQSVPPLPHQNDDHLSIIKGAYMVRQDHAEKLDCLIVATGTEVSLALDVADKLASSGQSCRVVSVPCLEVFLQQTLSERQALLKTARCQVVIEAALPVLWETCLDRVDLYFGVEAYGLSAPGPDVYQHFGLTCDNIHVKISDFLQGSS